MLGKLKRKKSEIQTKQNRIRRRIAEISGDLFGATGLLFAAVFFCLFFIYFYSVLVSSSYFLVKEISVRGLKELTEKDVLSDADIRPAVNLLAVNTDAIIRKVRSNHWVEDVYVGRELPDTLVLEIKERIPLALVKMEHDFYLMDVKGFVFKRLGRDDEIDLPIVTGLKEKVNIQNKILLRTLELLKAIGHSPEYAYLGTISEIHVDPLFGISLISDSGLYLKLGTEKFEDKLKKLKTVLADMEARGMRSRYVCIDLSDESKVTVKRRNVPEKTEQENKEKHYQI